MCRMLKDIEIGEEVWVHSYMLRHTNGEFVNPIVIFKWDPISERSYNPLLQVKRVSENEVDINTFYCGVSNSGYINEAAASREDTYFRIRYTFHSPRSFSYLYRELDKKLKKELNNTTERIIHVPIFILLICIPLKEPKVVIEGNQITATIVRDGVVYTLEEMHRTFDCSRMHYYASVEGPFLSYIFTCDDGIEKTHIYTSMLYHKTTPVLDNKAHQVIFDKLKLAIEEHLKN